MIFRRLLAVPCLLALGCGPGARKPVQYPGHGREDVKTLQALIANEAPAAFVREVGAEIADPQDILVRETG